MEQTLPNTQNPIKDRILEIYLDLCSISASLRNTILSKAPGNKHLEFIQFKSLMYEMYSLSFRYERMNQSIVKKVGTWMRKKNTSQKDEYILRSIDLFEEYAKELSKNDLIKM